MSKMDLGGRGPHLNLWRLGPRVALRGGTKNHRKLTMNSLLIYPSLPPNRPLNVADFG